MSSKSTYDKIIEEMKKHNIDPEDFFQKILQKYTLSKRKKSVDISEEDYQWLKENCINFNAFINKILQLARESNVNVLRDLIISCKKKSTT